MNGGFWGRANAKLRQRFHRHIDIKRKTHRHFGREIDRDTASDKQVDRHTNRLMLVFY